MGMHRGSPYTVCIVQVELAEQAGRQTFLSDRHSGAILSPAAPALEADFVAGNSPRN